MRARYTIGEDERFFPLENLWSRALYARLPSLSWASYSLMVGPPFPRRLHLWGIFSECSSRFVSSEPTSFKKRAVWSAPSCRACWYPSRRCFIITSSNPKRAGGAKRWHGSWPPRVVFRPRTSLYYPDHFYPPCEWCPRLPRIRSLGNWWAHCLDQSKDQMRIVRFVFEKSEDMVGRPCQQRL